MKEIKLKNEKNSIYLIFIGILLAVCLFAGGSCLYYRHQSNELRRVNDQLTERIADAEDTNRRLEQTIGKCKSICRNFEHSVDRNITTAREAIELIEETREAFQSIKMELNSSSSDDVYNRIDDWLESEGVDFVR